MENNYFDSKILEEILNIPSPTGYTKDMLNYLQKELNDMNVEYKISNKGALLATIKGKDSNRWIYDEFSRRGECNYSYKKW